MPTGTVTFVLTDIEASSRNWERDAAAMGPAVERHYAILDEVIIGCGGVRPVEQGEGDSVVAAFSRASDAVQAALSAQVRLRHELGDRFAVRMAVHTGDAQLRDEGNYFGPAIIRCARLRACAHGGQVLLSQTTADLVADHLPTGAGLLDLGVHRLRDLSVSERIYELCSVNLPGSGAFPPLHSVGIEGVGNLPVQLTPLVGREREVAEVATMVQQERVVTLIGTGGCGKTRLAGEVGVVLADRFPGGVWWCALAEYRDDDAVADALASALGIVPSLGRPLAVDVSERLRAGGEALVVLDNAEHLLDAVARATAALVADVPDVRVIVTSREPLSIPGEVAWRVPSLTFPTDGDTSSVGEFAAVALFVERAARSRPGFVLDDTNAAAVSTICRRLDGIPLAIELAAARVRTLAPERIAAQLDDRFRLLTGGARTLLARQQTLLASMAWSEALLDDAERAALRRLGVFVGGFTLDAAEHVLGAFDDTDAYAVLDIVGRLVDKSLVVLDDASGRYRMLETTRSFALARLLEAAEGDPARNAHLAWVIDFVTDQVRDEDVRQVAWRRAIEADWSNIAAALDWSTERAEDRCSLVAELGTFWLAEQRVTDAVTYGLDTIERFPDAPAWYRVVANCAPILHNAGVQDQMITQLEDARRRAEQADDRQSMNRIELARCVLDMNREGVHRDLLDRYAAVDEVAVLLGDNLTLRNTALLPFQALTFAGRLREAALREPGLPDMARIYSVRSLGAMYRGEFDEAATLLRDALVMAAAVGNASERLVAAGFCRTLDLLTDGVVSVAPPRVDVDERVEFAGVFATVQLMGRLTALVRNRRWDEAAALVEAAGGLASIRPSATSQVEIIHLHVLVTLGAVEEARALAQTLVDVARRRESPRLETEVRTVLSEIDDDAEHAYEALTLAEAHGLVLARIDALEVLAILSARGGDAERAGRLKLSAASARSEISYRLMWPTRKEGLDVVAIRDATHVDTLDDATAYALRGRGDRHRPAFGWRALTPTELDVARHVAGGDTNRQVADRMHVSPSTIKTHLDHIYAKLAINSRAQLAAAFAATTGGHDRA